MTEVFDTVVLRNGDRQDTLRADAFLSIPLAQRIRHILEHRVTFYRNGERIDNLVALDRKRQQALHPRPA